MRKLYNIDQRLMIEEIKDIMDDPRIVRVNSFNEDALEEFEIDLDKAHATGQPVIPVVIDSYGGSSYGLLGMIAAVESCRLPVATIVTSKAMSAGAVLFSFGTDGYRFMHPHATLMIHDCFTTMEGKVEDIKADSRQMDVLNAKMYQRMAEHCGLEANYFAELVRQHHHVDWYLDAKEAKKHKLANHLRVPKFEISIGLDIKFS